MLNAPIPDVLTDEALKQHPLAVWGELAIGLDDAQELKRKKPIPFEAAIELRQQVRVPTGSGLDMPLWLRRLHQEVLQVRARQSRIAVLAESFSHVPPRRLSHPELVRLLAEWEEGPSR